MWLTHEKGNGGGYHMSDLKLYSPGDFVDTNPRWTWGHLKLEIVGGKGVDRSHETIKVGQSHSALRSLKRWLPHE